MTSGALPVRESFRVIGRRITRSLSIGGVSGTSSVKLEDDTLCTPSHSDLQSVWDREFLLGTINHESVRAADRVVRIADVFCGAGGLSYGVREAVLGSGILSKIVLAADVDQVALDVYRRNFDPVNYSSRNVWTSVTTNYSVRRKRASFSGTPRVLTDDLRACQGQVDVLLGGPPCEGHSTSNNRTRRTDPRNMYYVAMPALAVALGASCVIVENVPGVQYDHRKVLDEAKALFKSSGYRIDDSVVDAMALGLPQTRKRHILIASRFAQPDLGAVIESLKRPQRDLRWAIGDLVDIKSSRLIDTPADLSEVNQGRIKYLFESGEYDLPNEWRPDSHKDGHTYPSIYGRLRWDKPSGTITTGFNSPGRGRYIHPELRRTITPHEAARIQGFPDRFEFNLINGDSPTRTSLANMIGDAVPPQIGYAAGVAALASIDLERLSGN